MKNDFKKDIFTKKELWEKSLAGDISILKDKNITLFKDIDEDTPLHYLARIEKIEILSHPEVDKVKNIQGNTPLHCLARTGRIEVLNHPEVTKVKNKFGITPLHHLAMAGKMEVLKHPQVATVTDIHGNTPLHYIMFTINVSKENIQELFPWYPLKKNEKIDENLITKILNTPQSVRFIYE